MLLTGSLILASLFMALSFHYSRYALLFFVIGVTIFVVGAISFQLVYAMHKFNEDKIETLKQMRPCPKCTKMIYKTDETCPYCKVSLRDE